MKFGGVIYRSMFVAVGKNPIYVLDGVFEKLHVFALKEVPNVGEPFLQAWSMRSSGTFLIQSTALKVWTSVQAPEASVLNVTFRNITKDDDKMLYDVNLVLTQKVIAGNSCREDPRGAA